MVNKEFFQALDVLEKEKKISREKLIEALEAGILFAYKKETGETIKNYILKEKIEESKNLLRFSDKSYIDISISLNFSSHSHFIATFKKYVNMTPKEYRNKFYGKQWDMDSEEGSE